jgi:subtilisin family serine protease
MRYNKILLCTTALVCLVFQAYAQQDYLDGSPSITMRYSGDYFNPNLGDSIEQPNTYGARPTLSSLQADEGLIPAGGHYMPRNLQVSKTGSNEVTALIPNLVAESGQVRSDGTINTYANVGSSANADSVAFLSFDTSSIPRDAIIRSVALEFKGWEMVGTPFSNLGCLNIYPASYHMLGSQSYSSMSTASPYAKICSSGQLNSPLSSPDFTRALRASLGQDRFQLRLQFDRATAGSQAGGPVVRRSYTTNVGPGNSNDYSSNGITKIIRSGGSNINGITKIITSGGSNINDYPSSIPDQQTLEDMGLDRTFVQSDLIKNGEGGNFKYILLTPDLNLSRLGIIPEIIEKAIEPGQVSVRNLYQNNYADTTATTQPTEAELNNNVIGVAHIGWISRGNTTIPSGGTPGGGSILCPDGTTYVSPGQSCPNPNDGGPGVYVVERQVCPDGTVVSPGEACPEPPPKVSQHLIKIAVVWLMVTYSLPQSLTPKENVTPKEKLPDLGPGNFTHPEPGPLINASSVNWGEVPANQVLVMINNTLGFEEARSIARQLAADLRGEVVGELQYINLFQIETKSRTMDNLIRDITYSRNYKSAVLAFPNQEVILESILDDNKIYQGESGKGYEIIGVSNSWDLINVSHIPLSEVKVGVTDDGIYKGYGEFNKEDINTSIEIYPQAPPSLLDSPVPNYTTAGSHGTGVTNILAADPDNSGLVGIASEPLYFEKKLKIFMVNIYDPNKSFVTDTFLGLKAEIQSGCTIFSCSWGNSKADEQTTEAYEVWFEKLSKDYPKLLFVCSAGNEGWAVDGKNRIPNGLPHGSLPNMITVGNIWNNGSLCPRSNYNLDNNYVTLAAPGEQAVWGRDNHGNVLNNYGGTSMATPHVAAAAALIRSINPSLNASEIKKIIMNTGRHATASSPAPVELGGRVLAINEAVKKAIDKSPKEVETTPEQPPTSIPTLEGSNTEVSGSPETTIPEINTNYRQSSRFDVTVTVKSTQYKGYDVKVDGNYIGTDGNGQDTLDGIYTFKVTGNQQHLIRVDHPLNWKWWQDFYNAGESYTYDF